MRVMVIRSQHFYEVIDKVLADHKVWDALNIHGEIEARFLSYTTDGFSLGREDLDNGVPYIENSILTTMGEILIILRNHHIDPEIERFIIERIWEKLDTEETVDNNPYL